MKNDFVPAVDHRFRLSADWGSVDCEVLEIEPNRTLSYTWAAMGLDSVVTWTLTPTGAGTHLKMEQTGFQPGQERPTMARNTAGTSSPRPSKRSWRSSTPNRPDAAREET